MFLEDLFEEARPPSTLRCYGGVSETCGVILVEFSDCIQVTANRVMFYDSSEEDVARA